MCVFRVSGSGVSLQWFTFLPLVTNLLHYNEAVNRLTSVHLITPKHILASAAMTNKRAC